MAAGHQVDSSWMWHPSFSEEKADTAGLFVHFRRSFTIDTLAEVPSSLKIHVTADTRYKLYVNRRLVSFGPVKGDSALWFYDEVDIAPYLTQGLNKVLIIVLRFFHGTKYGTSFPRLPVGGLRVVVPSDHGRWSGLVGSSTIWETAIDPTAVLRTDEPEDDFLHIYEHVVAGNDKAWSWTAAKLHEFQVSTGNAPPWNLSPRMIPPMKREKCEFYGIHNLQSPIEETTWSATLLNSGTNHTRPPLRLPAHSQHHFDLEVEHHTTGFLRFRFEKPDTTGSVLKVVYSESYEDPPTLVPYLRRKGNRRDTTKAIYGPSDTYHFSGSDLKGQMWNLEEGEEVYAPFHFRTFRFLRVSILVGSASLVLKGFDIEKVTYPLDIKAALALSDSDNRLWSTSIRTLLNCMHDCYEDCPFYEQLQYAMDTRSSILFTYRLSGDDRLARQAILQLYNSFQPQIGLTASRAPSHGRQIIPNFSLFWICMVNDHLEHFSDVKFLSQFAPIVDAVLGYFQDRIGSLGLVVSDFIPGIWNFTDWAEEWKPYGIPSLVVKTRISTYTNHLYAYTLRHAATLVTALGRRGLAEEYLHRADEVVHALRKHCFDGEFFADSLASGADRAKDYSLQNQAWGVLSGAIRGTEAQELMRKALDPESPQRLVSASISMSFYTIRALSLAGGTVYNDNFHRFWAPWHAQIALGVTTWEEDDVSQRSDCHAWGCAPIYDFMVEIAGIRPADHGWSAISFKPRLELYRHFAASCPFNMPAGAGIGVAHVSWDYDGLKQTTVSLKFEMPRHIVIPVLVHLPGHELRLMDTANSITLTVDRG